MAQNCLLVNWPIETSSTWKGHLTVQRIIPESQATLNVWARTDSRRRGPEVRFWSITVFGRSYRGTCPRSRFMGSFLFFRYAEI
jgi:hypothetical protein